METFFDSSYHMKGKGNSGLSTIEYIEDRRYEEQGVAVLIVKGDAPYAPRQATFWPGVKEELNWLKSQYGENLERATVVIQNARFDGSILVRKHGIVPPFCVDILALSRHGDARNTHNLHDLCERWNLPPKGDTMNFKGVHWETASVEMRSAFAAYACNDAEREFDLFALMLPRLTRPEVELPLQRHTLRLFWEPELVFDFAEADRLTGLMEAQAAKDTEAVGYTLKGISGNTSFANILSAALAETGEVLAMKQGKKKMIAALAKDDEAVEQYKRHRNPKVRDLIKARQSVKSWPLHLKRVESMRAQAEAAGGRLPNAVNYYGASTGRFSGGEGINLQNLPTRGGGLQCEIKHLLRAPAGCLIVHADAAQIEARGLAWLAGQTDLVQAFAQNRDIYSDFAAEVLGAPCRKPRKDDPPAVAKVLSTRRSLGKVGILGMGYGMGSVRALEYMEDFPDLRPKVESGEIDLAFCKNFVDTYRNRYRMIPALWRDLEASFTYVTRYGQPRTLRGLTMSREGTTTVLTLPSGRSLFYPHAHVDGEGRLQWKAGPTWADLWGGSLVENCIQAVSRDVLVEAVLAVEAAGFRVALHCHDSIVVSVEKSRAEEAKACVCAALVSPPLWAPNWPLGVEASTSERYE
jgi:DNA polymerase